MGEMLQIIKNLDRGFYREVDARRRSEGGATSFGYLAELAAERGLAPEERERQTRERKLLARFGCGTMEDHRAEKVAAFARQTWALELAFREMGIRTRGPEADVLGKVFASSASTVLFPAYVETQVVAGLLLASLVPAIVAQEVLVNSHTAEHLAMTESEADRRTSRTGEGAPGTVVTLRTAERSVKLEKYAAQLDATYESLRLQRMNVVGLFLQRLGEQLGMDETDDALEVAIAGDGNSGSAATITNSDVDDTLDYDDLIKLVLAFPKGYQMRVAITGDTNLRTILNMSEFKDAAIGDNAFTRLNAVLGPLAAQWHRWTRTTTSFTDDRILGIDSRLALVQYTEQGVVTESDRLIDKQFERTVVSKWTGFAKLDYNAVQVLDRNWA
ncbi:MAG: hypothetical protein HY320_08930 [Armatimonadetes bacterium]|nr:hypothetical protein [Armatimonadota bacterium]